MPSTKIKNSATQKLQNHHNNMGAVSSPAFRK